MQFIKKAVVAAALSTLFVLPVQGHPTGGNAAGVAAAVSAATAHASWYGPGFNGRRTANGERYDMHAMTAAHKTLPFGTKVRVTNVANGRSAIVRINDRGPFVRGREIDLSRGAAVAVGMLGAGVARVRLEIL